MVCHHFLSYIFATIDQVCHKTCARTGKAENLKLQTLIIMLQWPRSALVSVNSIPILILQFDFDSDILT